MEGVRRTRTASSDGAVASKLPLGEGGGGGNPASVTTEIREGELGIIQGEGGQIHVVVYHVLKIPAVGSRSTKTKEIKGIKRLSRQAKKCSQTLKNSERKNSRKNKPIEEVKKSVPVRDVQRANGVVEINIDDSDIPDSEKHQSRSRLKEGNETAFRQPRNQMNAKQKRIEVITISDDEDEDDFADKVQNDDGDATNIGRPSEMPVTEIEQELHVPAIRIKSLEELQSPTRPKEVEVVNESFKGATKKTKKDAHGQVPPCKLNILKSCNRKKCTTTITEESQATIVSHNSFAVQMNRIKSVPCSFSMNNQNPPSTESEITISTILGLPKKTSVNRDQPPRKHPRKEKHQFRLSPSHVHSGDSFTLPNSALQIQTSKNLSSVHEASSNCKSTRPFTKSSDQAEEPTTATEATTIAGVPHPEGVLDEDPWRMCTDCGIVFKPSRGVHYEGLSCDHATTKQLCQDDLTNLYMCECCHQVIIQRKLRSHKFKNVKCRKSDKNELVLSYEKLKKSHKKSPGIFTERDRFRVVNEFSALHQCAVCAEWLDSLLSLKSHVGKLHCKLANCVTFDPTYMCRKCGRVFPDSFELVAHANLCEAVIQLDKYVFQSGL